MEFAFVTFVNNNIKYINLMKSTIKSVELFSNYPLILYCVDIPIEINTFKASDKCIIKNITCPEYLKNSIYYLKPYIILDSIKNGLKNGYYIEADDLVTPNCNSIINYLSKIDKYPISPIHPIDNIISTNFMTNLNVFSKTQHYIHAHVLFKDSNLKFIEEWLENCKISTGECWDESVLNCMYWKYNLKNHYLEIIDPEYNSIHSDNNIIKTAITLHGCKNPHEHNKILNKMIYLHKKNLSNI